MTVDINCDLGESFGAYQIGNDEAIFPHITSCNIACGMHGGDPWHIQQTIKKALKYKVQIGAHPGYPDLAGFGRRKLNLPIEQLNASVRYQISALKGMVSSLGGRLNYVKPHGALYNHMAESAETTDSVLEVVKQVDPALKIMGLAGSLVAGSAKEKGLLFIPEAFIDRRYQSNGRLRPRSLDMSVLTDPAEAVQQALGIILENKVTDLRGNSITVVAESLCIHGDNPMAPDILTSLNQALDQQGISAKAF